MIVFLVIPIVVPCGNPVPTKFKAGGSKVVGVTSTGADGFPGVERSIGSNIGNATVGALGL